jgi:IrrE N-terminal-like domain
MQEIERKAQRVLERVPEWLWNGESLPVPVEHIADTCFGLLVRDVHDMSAAPGSPELQPGQSLSGLLLPTAHEIWVNADEAGRWPPRRRFTICHELGHWCMHRAAGDGSAIFCRSATVEPAESNAARRATPDIEEEAQMFAAAMLIPADLLRREYKRKPEFDHLCHLFGASKVAMGKRLHQVV